MFGGKSEDAGKAYRIGKQVIAESELKIQIPYKGDMFTLKYPTPILRTMIETEIARRLGGYARSSYTTEHLSLVEACATIDLLMIPEECPNWFLPWECLDEALIAALYDGYFRFRDQLRERLRSTGPESGSKGGGT